MGLPGGKQGLRPVSFGARRAALIPAGYGALALILLLATRFRRVSLLMILCVAFFHVAWMVIRGRFRDYPDGSGAARPVRRAAAPRGRACTMAAMVLLSATLCALLVPLAFKGVENPRMVWAFHEDEGWVCDLYQRFVTARKLDFGESWGYTYGSLNLMLVSMAARLLRPLVVLDGSDCIILNRLLLTAALLGTGWATYFAGRRLLSSPLAGLAAAALLWSNCKVVEMALLANYPDTFGMLLLTLAALWFVRAYVEMTPRSLFLAPLLLGLGFSVKYMGLPLLVLMAAGFWLAQCRVAAARPDIPRHRLWADLAIYLGYLLAAMPVAFVLVNPLYLINWRRFLTQMRAIVALYHSGNVNNLPESAVVVPTWSDWWQVAGAGGAADHLLICGAAVAVLWSVAGLAVRRGRWSGADVLSIFAGAFSVLWVVFVTRNSRFAFFHYFMPITPLVYLLACSLPVRAARVFPERCRRLRFATSGVLACGLLAAIAWPVVQRARFLISAEPATPRSAIVVDSVLRSRPGLHWRWFSAVRDQNHVSIQVGRWLETSCPEARSLITSEAVFYYPPSITEIRYLNRQLGLRQLFEHAPDLLILSDWFIEMYTRDYSPQEIEAMPREARDEFQRVRELYLLARRGDRLLNYRRIRTFDAPAGCYWKRLHVYRRSGPASLAGLVDRVGGTPLISPPNGADVLFAEGPIPEGMYLATPVDRPPPLPLRLELSCRRPIRLDGIGFVWWSCEHHPARATIAGYREERCVFSEAAQVCTGMDISYTWMPIADAPELDRIELTVPAFVGQERLIIRRVLVAVHQPEGGGDAPPAGRR